MTTPKPLAHLGVSKNSHNRHYTLATSNGLTKGKLNSDDDLLDFIKNKSKVVKIVSVTTNFKFTDNALGKLWLNFDIITFHHNSDNSDFLAQFGKSKFLGLVPKLEISKEGKVTPASLVPVSIYKNKVQKSKWNTLVSLLFQNNKSCMFISATPRGGGVAIMRHATIRLLSKLNENFSWYVLIDDPQIFTITKTKFHNVLQGITHSQVKLTTKDKVLYENWIEKNFQKLKIALSKTDIVIIDDPQPSGLIPLIKKEFPKIKIIYRSHIQIDTKLVDKSGSEEHAVWEYLHKNIILADKFISHPVKSFVPKNIPEKKVIFMPPSTDPLDGLNKTLTKPQIKFYNGLFNNLLEDINQKPLNFDKPYIIQIARFDPSKGFTDALEAYKNIAQKLPTNSIPQLVLVGNGSIDDPETDPILNLLHEQISQNSYDLIRENIKLAKLPHIDQLLNALLAQATLCLQLSHKEGFEFKVIEALMKGIPVVAYNSGGIPLQIKNHKNGIILQTGNIENLSQTLYTLFSNDTLLSKLRNQTYKATRSDLTTIDNVNRWLSVINQLS